MIMIAGRLSLLGFVFKPVSWVAGDSRLRQTLSLRIHLVERESLSPSAQLVLQLLPSHLTGPLKPPLVPALAGLSPVLLYFR